LVDSMKSLLDIEDNDTESTDTKLSNEICEWNDEEVLDANDIISSCFQRPYEVKQMWLNMKGNQGEINTETRKSNKRS
jgi:hypothetical protein